MNARIDTQVSPPVYTAANIYVYGKRSVLEQCGGKNCRFDCRRQRRDGHEFNYSSTCVHSTSKPAFPSSLTSRYIFSNANTTYYFNTSNSSSGAITLTMTTVTEGPSGS